MERISMRHSQESGKESVHSDGQFFAKLMDASRKNLLDLSLRNRLLNYSPADPEQKDDGRAHKYLVVRGKVKAVWERLVSDAKQLRIFRFSPQELGEALKRLNESLRRANSKSEAELLRSRISEIQEEIAEGEQSAAEGHVWVEKLSEEGYQKRLRRLRDEAKTLEDTTGDSAFFLACGFLKWPERPKPNRSSVDPASDGVSTARFAPLLLVKISLTDEGKGTPGRRKYRIVPADDPQDNQSLVAKLKEDWDFSLPSFKEGSTPADYFASVRRAITVSKLVGFEVQETLALGFFNFARYRLWLDLDPKQWTGVSPDRHPIVRSILGVEPLDTSCPRVIDATRDDAIADEVARHQESEDIPIVRDADASQYSALLYARKGKSLVVIGPPGSGKSQTITNLVATSIANGKRVLFVAQKLPALDVVARRVREAGLGQFCLQFYSAKQDGEPDRKPVTPIQIHAQLTAARNMLGGRSRNGVGERRGPVLAKKLNGYAAALHKIHPVHGDSIQNILCEALLLKEQTQASWGELWDEALLSIDIPSDQPVLPEWRETRRKFVGELARLNLEAGSFWIGWRPDKLTALDLPHIERQISERHRALRHLCDWCRVIADNLADWPITRLQELASEALEAKAPTPCSDELLRAISTNDQLMRDLHELERELLEGEAASEEGKKVFELVPEGHRATAELATGHLSTILRSVSSDTTFAEVQDSLEKLSELLRRTDDITDNTKRFPEGLLAFSPEYSGEATMSLAILVAQQHEGNFRRPPANLLLPFARILTQRPECSDEAFVIADQVEQLLQCRRDAARIFTHSLRAENAITGSFVEALADLCRAGFGNQLVGATEGAENTLRELSEVTDEIRKYDRPLADAAANDPHGLTVAQILRLAKLHPELDQLKLNPPQECDERTIRAWATNQISEDEARAAASAQDRAGEINHELGRLVSDQQLAHTNLDQMESALSAAQRLGLQEIPVVKLNEINATAEAFAATAKRFIEEFHTISAVDAGKDFKHLNHALQAMECFERMPELHGIQADTLLNREKLNRLSAVARKAEDLRGTVISGLGKTLSEAAEAIRTCIAAADAADSAAQNVSGIQRPTTLRELRSIGASISLLRSMPSLPVGCDPIAMSSDQCAATILILRRRSDEIGQLISSLPAGCNFDSLPTAADARQSLECLRQETNVFRFLSKDWRKANRLVKSFAPSLKREDAIGAFSKAVELKLAEEELAVDPSGTAAMGSHFRGRKTDWGPFIEFAEWAKRLAGILAGFEGNERIVAAWRAEGRVMHIIANACAQFEEAVVKYRAGWPELFDGVVAPFQDDVSVEEAQKRAASVLRDIDAILSSRILRVTDVKSNRTAFSHALPELLRTVLGVEHEIRSLGAGLQFLVSKDFAATPEEWSALREIADWALRIHSQPEFSLSADQLFNLVTSNIAAIQRMKLDADQLRTGLVQLQEPLASGCVRLEDQALVDFCLTSLVAEMAVVVNGAKILRGMPQDSIATLAHAAELTRSAQVELTRAARLRNAIAPTIPSVISVERSLGWAVELHAHGVPKALIAFLALNAEQAAKVKPLIELAVIFAKRREAVIRAGFTTAPWLLHTAHLDDIFAGAGSAHETLKVANIRAKDCGAKSPCSFDELRAGAKAVSVGCELQRKSATWLTTIGCDPLAIEHPAEAIRETIYWIESLHSDRIPIGVIEWIITNDPDVRIQWWANLVNAARAWKQQRASLRQASLPEFENQMPLEAWRSTLSSNYAALSVAVSEIGRILKMPKLALNKASLAADALWRCSESFSRAEVIRNRLPGGLEIKKAGEAAMHRAYAVRIAELPIELSTWLLTTTTQQSCEHLRQLGVLLEAESASYNALAGSLEKYGEYDAQGPSQLLSQNLTVKAAFDLIERAIANLPAVASWAALLREKTRAKKLGLERLCEIACEKSVTGEQAMQAFTAAVAWQKALLVCKENPALGRFRSSRHEDLRAEFFQEDQSAVNTYNRGRIIAVLKEQTGGGMASWGNGSIDQLLLHEASKRKKLLPVRKLVETAGKRMQELCPCWLATPNAIAQFMAPGATDFDLVIMDEASQLTPEDSWGAIARGRQLVVVGDPRQMPPSSFFEHAAADDGEDEESESPKDEKPTGFTLRGHQQESVLKAAEACLPQVWLNWHYRSLHQSLIAPANTLSYDRRLVLFPSSHINHQHLGVQHKFVEDGVATTGQVKNANEAAAVVDRLVAITAEFAQSSHRRLKKAPHSVGVIAMNIHQQEIIKELIENRKGSDPTFERNMTVLEEHDTEPFFVRNLENVQGDERDVILVSTTYGPNTPGGTPTQRFFPINQEGGERRFNVLITRSKWRMEVFTSLRAAQLKSSQLGVQHMRSFLEFCESGVMMETGHLSGRSVDSPFEAHVKAVLEAKGYPVVPQIGVAGYFIDLGIRDPLAPDRFVLGIECDGATYHSSRCARDRDRLREQVLLERGWNLHRIWSTEWFYNNAAVRKELFAAVEKALGVE